MAVVMRVTDRQVIPLLVHIDVARTLADLVTDVCNTVDAFEARYPEWKVDNFDATDYEAEDPWCIDMIHYAPDTEPQDIAVYPDHTMWASFGETTPVRPWVTVEVQYLDLWSALRTLVSEYGAFGVRMWRDLRTARTEADPTVSTPSSEEDTHA